MGVSWIWATVSLALLVDRPQAQLTPPPWAKIPCAYGNGNEGVRVVWSMTKDNRAPETVYQLVDGRVAQSNPDFRMDLSDAKKGVYDLLAKLTQHNIGAQFFCMVSAKDGHVPLHGQQAKISGSMFVKNPAGSSTYWWQPDDSPAHESKPRFPAATRTPTRNPWQPTSTNAWQWRPTDAHRGNFQPWRPTAAPGHGFRPWRTTTPPPNRVFRPWEHAQAGGHPSSWVTTATPRVKPTISKVNDMVMISGRTFKYGSQGEWVPLMCRDPEVGRSDYHVRWRGHLRSGFLERMVVYPEEPGKQIPPFVALHARPEQGMFDLWVQLLPETENTFFECIVEDKNGKTLFATAGTIRRGRPPTPAPQGFDPMYGYTKDVRGKAGSDLPLPCRPWSNVADENNPVTSMKWLLLDNGGRHQTVASWTPQGGVTLTDSKKYGFSEEQAKEQVFDLLLRSVTDEDNHDLYICRMKSNFREMDVTFELKISSPTTSAQKIDDHSETEVAKPVEIEGKPAPEILPGTNETLAVFFGKQYRCVPNGEPVLEARESTSSENLVIFFGRHYHCRADGKTELHFSDSTKEQNFKK